MTRIVNMGILNASSKSESQILSYKQDTEIRILCFVKSLSLVIFYIVVVCIDISFNLMILLLLIIALMSTFN